MQNCQGLCAHLTAAANVIGFKGKHSDAMHKFDNAKLLQSARFERVSPKTYFKRTTTCRNR